MKVELRVLYTNEFNSIFLNSKILIDKSKICQVIRNVLLNSLQATFKTVTKVVTVEIGCYYSHENHALEDMKVTASMYELSLVSWPWGWLRKYLMNTQIVHPTAGFDSVQDVIGLKITISDTGIGMTQV
jgi:signal transduction histidine kinase